MIQLAPTEIEQKSFQIITEELGDCSFLPEELLVVKRVIHTSADFDYAKNLVFSERAVANTVSALKRGCDIVTDTQMAKAGINKTVLNNLGGQIHCFIGDQDVAILAKEQNTTSSAVAMEKAATLNKSCIFAIGNAPTALLRLVELYNSGLINPVLVIGVPVGFVNVVESKELLQKTNLPYIVANGRKGGSNVAAAIVNAMLYQISS